MARVKLEMPEQYQFSTTIDVLISHINYGGHLGNDSFLTIIQEARLRFLESLGYSEFDIEGLGIVVADVAVQYLAEGFRGDRLRVDLSLGEPSRRGFELHYRLVRLGDSRELARAKTGIVFFDYASRCAATMPEGFKRHFPG